MKKTAILLFVILLASTFSVSAQSKDSIESKFIYCRLMCGAEMARTGVDVWIDYGRKEVANEDKVRFKSIIEAVNVMADRGWDMVTMYPMGSITYCILKKQRDHDQAPL